MAIAEANTTERRDGVLYGAAAYLLWGVVPLFFPLLKPAGAIEILAQRIVWSLIVVAAVLAISRGFGSFRAVLRERRKVLLLGVAAVLIAVNWGTFIYAVNSDHVIESSLGYFITPLVSAAFGVLVFREQLHLHARRPRPPAAPDGIGDRHRAAAAAVLGLRHARAAHRNRDAAVPRA